MCPLIVVGLGSIGSGNIPYLNFGGDIGRCDWDGFGDKDGMMDGR